MGADTLQYLGLARKAGKLAAGYEKTAAAVKRGSAALVVVAGDISPKTEKELQRLAGGRVEVLRLSAGMEQVSRAAGINAGVAAVTDEGFAAAIGKAEVNGKV